MAESEFERVMKYSNVAMDYLRRGEIPPYPQFYELFYTYATGVNAPLNERLNALLLSPPASFVDAAEDLYNEFMRSKSADERIAAVSKRISKNIENVNSVIEQASTNATSYSGSLAEAETKFGTDLDPEALRAMTAELIRQTHQMREANAELETKLDASRADIEMLKRDLDDVQRETMTDALTKISNRKCFDMEIERAIEDAVEFKHSLALVMIDIDHFKKFNDTYGHQIGDQVLRLVAMTLRAHTKGQDLAARYGGEEFVIILPDTNVDGAHALCEKIRKAVQAKELLRKSTNEKLGRITASFGISIFRDGDNSTSLIERADKALYAAKENGRNQVISEFDKLAKVKLMEVAA
ncbi:MAG: GGDEF domain-containing protein [Hyphomicrobiaceae bacterium]|nr:GGDEF domain-containing protein [Hyphomicrobiaceae bacterium]MCC0023531.1 GGDEF domain-containing protein [Hyphomicrobiaceae bacterium]